MDRDFHQFTRQVEEAAAYLRKLIAPPEILFILGTGLGVLAEEITSRVVIPYDTIPHFPLAAGNGHAGNLVTGMFAGRPVAALQGRCHFYEGYSTREITLPLRVLAQFKPRYCFIASAAGGLNPGYDPGDLMVISDHINCIFDNPLRGPNVEAWGLRFPDLTQCYDRQLQAAFIGSAATLGIGNVQSGVYIAVPGPSLETPAEIRWLRNCGADAVGMSTVPEVIVAIHAGLRVLAVAVIANVNNPDNQQPVLLEEVIAVAGQAGKNLSRIMHEVVKTF